MATGVNTSQKSKQVVIKAIRNFRQKVHYFKWKLWKYQDASETYFMERNFEMVDFCDKNVDAYKKAFVAANRMLETLEEKLKANYK